MTTPSTTLDRIVRLEDEYIRLVSAADWEEEDRWRCIAIRADLAQLWPARRAELVFAQHGTPRMVSAPDPRSHMRLVSMGMAPLPSGRR